MSGPTASCMPRGQAVGNGPHSIRVATEHGHAAAQRSTCPLAGWLHAGKEGTLHTWDLRTRRCLQRAQDEGALRSTCLAACPSSGQVAMGADSGVVNLYPGPESRCAQQRSPPMPGRGSSVSLHVWLRDSRTTHATWPAAADLLASCLPLGTPGVCAYEASANSPCSLSSADSLMYRGSAGSHSQLRTAQQYRVLPRQPGCQHPGTPS